MTKVKNVFMKDFSCLFLGKSNLLFDDFTGKKSGSKHLQQKLSATSLSSEKAGGSVN